MWKRIEEKYGSCRQREILAFYAILDREYNITWHQCTRYPRTRVYAHSRDVLKRLLRLSVLESTQA